MIIDSEYHNSDEHEDEISDSDKNIEASKESITNIHVSNTSVRICKCQASRCWSRNHWTRGDVASPKA